MTPDIIATVKLYETDRDGREGPTPPGAFGCLFELDGEYFDCRLLLEEIGALRPGQLATVPIKFLNPDMLGPRLRAAQCFHLWDGKVIADGEVKEIVMVNK